MPMNAVKTDVKGRIAEIVGQKGLVGDEASYAVDGLTPAVVVAPESAEQVAQIVRFAHEAELAVIPWGGGTAMGVGKSPRAVNIVLLLTRLNKIVDYSPEDMTVTAQAGVTLEQLRKAMAGNGQMLPLDPPQPQQATVGGVLATNASGPLRYQFGMPRDLVLGTLVVYADGTAAKAGGRTVKNVAGYDMSRLHIGAFGTLGIIVETTFKVSPVPKSMITVSGSFDTVAAASAAARALRMARIVPWSLALAGPGALSAADQLYTVAVRLGGQPAVVEPQAQRALDMLKQAGCAAPAAFDNAEETLWPAIRDWPDVVGDKSSVLVRLGTTPSHVLAVMTSVHDLAVQHGLEAAMLAQPGVALVHVHLSSPGEKAVDAVTGMLAASKEWNGNLVVERCPTALKDRLPVWGAAQAEPLSLRVKNTFDPKGTLNPGRFVAG